MMTAMSSLCMHTATNFSSSLWFWPKRKSAMVTWTAAINSKGREDVELHPCEQLPHDSLVPPSLLQHLIQSSFEHLSHDSLYPCEQISYACLS